MKKGFTLVELLAVIVVLAIILAIAVPSITGIIDTSKRSAFESDAKMVITAIEYKELEDDTFNPETITKNNMETLLGISGDNYSNIEVTVLSGKINVNIVGNNKFKGLTASGTKRNIKIASNDEVSDTTPPVITLLGSSTVSINSGTTYTDAGATALDDQDGDITSNIVVTGSVNVNIAGTYTITYNVSDAAGNPAIEGQRTVNVLGSLAGPVFIESKGVNGPVLAAGMVPVKWNGSSWDDTNIYDSAWYNYANKEWANARTADGSMWVWIPRYIYKIPTANWHTKNAATINVQFSINTDDTLGETVTLDTGTSSNASNDKWTNHPAFTFGTDQLTGIWVAKFEMSGTSAALNSKPNVASYRSVTVGNMFTYSRNMETNTRYGWGTSGTGIDTHMTKNIEWGAVAYLAQSTYGKNSEVWINNSSTYITGCAGSGPSVASYAGCENTYDSSNGVQASTTGTIYGIYDMSGGANEFVAAYMDNGNASLTTYSLSLLNADIKYKDTYAVTTPVDEVNDYALTINKKGDAIYETSSSYTNALAWYGDYSDIPYSSTPWFPRGGRSSDGAIAGLFYFRGTYSGDAATNISWRTTLLVSTGL